MGRKRRPKTVTAIHILKSQPEILIIPRAEVDAVLKCIPHHRQRVVMYHAVYTI